MAMTNLLEEIIYTVCILAFNYYPQEFIGWVVRKIEKLFACNELSNQAVRGSRSSLTRECLKAIEEDRRMRERQIKKDVLVIHGARTTELMEGSDEATERSLTVENIQPTKSINCADSSTLAMTGDEQTILSFNYSTQSMSTFDCTNASIMSLKFKEKVDRRASEIQYTSSSIRDLFMSEKAKDSTPILPRQNSMSEIKLTCQQSYNERNLSTGGLQVGTTPRGERVARHSSTQNLDTPVHEPTIRTVRPNSTLKELLKGDEKICASSRRAAKKQPSLTKSRRHSLLGVLEPTTVEPPSRVDFRNNETGSTTDFIKQSSKRRMRQTSARALQTSRQLSRRDVSQISARDAWMISRADLKQNIRQESARQKQNIRQESARQLRPSRHHSMNVRHSSVPTLTVELSARNLTIQHSSSPNCNNVLKKPLQTSSCGTNSANVCTDSKENHRTPSTPQVTPLRVSPKGDVLPQTPQRTKSIDIFQGVSKNNQITTEIQPRSDIPPCTPEAKSSVSPVVDDHSKCKIAEGSCPSSRNSHNRDDLRVPDGVEVDHLATNSRSQINSVHKRSKTRPLFRSQISVKGVKSDEPPQTPSRKESFVEDDMPENSNSEPCSKVCIAKHGPSDASKPVLPQETDTQESSSERVDFALHSLHIQKSNSANNPVARARTGGNQESPRKLIIQGGLESPDSVIQFGEQHTSTVKEPNEHISSPNSKRRFPRQQSQSGFRGLSSSMRSLLSNTSMSELTFESIPEPPLCESEVPVGRESMKLRRRSRTGLQPVPNRARRFPRQHSSANLMMQQQSSSMRSLSSISIMSEVTYDEPTPGVYWQEQKESRKDTRCMIFTGMQLEIRPGQKRHLPCKS